MASSLGTLFRIATFGESHGGSVGVVIDGCPPGHKIDLSLVQTFLGRRRPGQSHLTSPRNEADQVECLAGLTNGITLGSPICLLVRNKDFKPQDYQDLKQVFRPSHADFTTQSKFGINAPSGGGRASARETIGRVAAAAVAEQVLAHITPDLRVVAYVDSVKDLKVSIEDPERVTRADVEKNPLRCPDQAVADKMEKLIVDTKKKGDSVGGTIFCGIKGAPIGLGEPVFDKLEADLGKAVLSLPASKGFEIGTGFSATSLYGSEHNDEFIKEEGQVRTASNRSGGVQGGMSNGAFIYFRTAFKPVSTIFKDQRSVTTDGEEVTFKPDAGRHDPCVLPRAVPMVEAMALLVIIDHVMRHRALSACRGPEARA